MHYIRLLRAPKLTYDKGRKHPWSLNVVLTVTTDLGDSFLNPDDHEPVKLKISAGWEQPSKQPKADDPLLLAAEKVLRWTPGMRVLKADIPAQHLTTPALPNPGLGPLRVLVRASGRQSADAATDVVFAGLDGDCGKVMPVWADVQTPDHSEAPTTCVRRLAHGGRDSEPCVEIEEDIGESIARHIWDAGLTAISTLWLANDRDGHDDAAKRPWCMNRLRGLLFGGHPLNVLELGCGVGILGNGLAQIMTREDPEGKSSILMTDLPEAEQRARANMARLATAGTASIRPEYENLDWDDGRKGELGPLAGARAWDLIAMSDCTYNVDVLPSLINTWTAVHVHNISRSSRPGGGSDGPVRTHVYVAWKKRHPDENEFWHLVDDAGWVLLEEDVVELPVLGGETESIFSYLFETRSQRYERVAETGTWKCLDRAGAKPR
ncbi:hypothetical protein CGRA01v4_14118 [Colletotrichum graminicola]|uniref:Uncharacterized protein n=1 Tax=Colletotrichum graminicola (strain M1.001 / M2 / FGSC 10212) TaxID=645133 RepID=E3QUX8_COLGM|nr:uncharacterized protein GLRG_09810 [Colletotrichum graminicola M1.001]EFQ34666.1 hypothetical protein GLRG_09810 [Colletotrichum graminicola M1.001]WDK22827.1 hypothetical protein CGRA01v4_14118 [Colletotrichum graminicola]